MTHGSHRLALILLLVANMVGTMAPAMAQMQKPPNEDPHILGGGLFAPPKKPKQAPPITIKSPTWPRLDRGAVLCRTQADLRRLAERRRGQTTDAVDCQVIRDATPISILRREGAGMTEVRTANPSAGGEGWTDAWLPDRPPVR